MISTASDNGGNRYVAPAGTTGPVPSATMSNGGETTLIHHPPPGPAGRRFWHSRRHGLFAIAIDRDVKILIGATPGFRSVQCVGQDSASRRKVRLVRLRPCHEMSGREPVHLRSPRRTGSCAGPDAVFERDLGARIQKVFVSSASVQSNQLISLSWHQALLLPHCVRRNSSPG